MEKINENIYRLKIQYKDIFTTVYLIKTSLGAVLFDVATTEEDVKNQIIPFLKEIGITSDRLKYVFVSHNHRDHAGGLKSFMEEFPETVIVARSADLKSLYEGYNFISPKDNQVILEDLRVITITGHTQCSCALLDTRTNTLITGDCLQLYGIFGSKDWACNIRYPAEHMAEINKLRSMDINDIYMAHDYHPCGYKASGKEEINRVLDLCIEPLFYIKDIIIQNPQLDDEEIRNIYNNSDNIPTVGAHVIAAVRAEVNDGRF